MVLTRLLVREGAELPRVLFLILTRLLEELPKLAPASYEPTTRMLNKKLESIACDLIHSQFHIECSLYKLHLVTCVGYPQL